MSTTDLWPIALEALMALDAQYRPAIQQVVDGTPLGNGGLWLVWMAWLLEPEPIGAAALQANKPYSAASCLAEGLAKVAQEGFLAPNAGNHYRLTEAGRTAVQRAVEAIHGSLAPLDPLPAAGLDRLAALLRRLVEASLAAPEPPPKVCLVRSHSADPGGGAPSLVRIDQYLTDLYTYRDDAHRASWRRSGFSGQAWETLTCLWLGEALSLDDLHGKLQNRGHSRAVYVEAVQELVRRGLVKEKQGTCLVTKQGQALRQAAEDDTDRMFYAPWVCLVDGEIRELRDLLVGLREGLCRAGTSRSEEGDVVR